MRTLRPSSSLFHRHAQSAAEHAFAEPARRAAPGPTASFDTFTPAGPVRVSPGTVTGYSALERQKLDRATAKLGEVLNSREFRDAVLAHTFAGKSGFASDERTPAEVYAVIRAAKERYTAVADGEVDLNLELRTLSWFQRGVVGYTREGSETITTNRRHFSGFDEAGIAGHLGHEWLHTLGFEHDFKATARRPHSVPYALGDLIEALASRPTLTPV
ncbi:MAG: hypothetical protein INH41_12835 [Myxococcaceae bacterium]|nr:hypothetical protein [Myxococcaceae bacterium]